MSANPVSDYSVTQDTAVVNFVPYAVLYTTAPLPAGVRPSADGRTLCKRCPACGGEIVAENTPQAVAWMAARDRICRPCDEDMQANGLAWMPREPEETTIKETTIAWGAACHCGYGDCEICYPVD